jgi:hypothetical protein
VAAGAPAASVSLRAPRSVGRSEWWTAARDLGGDDEDGRGIVLGRLDGMIW